MELPEDLITNILLHLPVKSLVRFQCVCKRWLSIITDPRFVKAHLRIHGQTLFLISKCDANHSTPIDIYSTALDHQDAFTQPLTNLFNPLRSSRHPTKIFGSCNGLVLLYNSDQEIAIWNPSTRRCRILPIDQSILSISFTHRAYGFGYDAIHDDYKAVRILQFHKFIGANLSCEVNKHTGAILSYEVKVYNLKSNSWRKVKDYPFEEFMFDQSGGKFTHGAVHWLNRNRASGAELLVAFDVNLEEFRVLPLPSGEHNDAYYFLELLGGCLCIHMFYKTKVEVWMMKEYGVQESWIKYFCVEQIDWFLSSVRPLVHSKSGEEVLVEQDYEKLFWYDLRTNRKRRVFMQEMPKLFSAEVYVQSLVQL